MSQADDRSRALRDLVELRLPLGTALDRISGFPWDSDEGYITLTSSDLLRALDEFDRGRLTEGELTSWAEALIGRDDIDVDSREHAILSEALFRLSTPELFGPLSSIVSDLRPRLQP